MTRVTLVLNEHGAVSETFQRTLARTLAEGGYDVVVHAMHGGLPEGPSPHPRVSFSVGSPDGAGAAAAIRGAVRSGASDLARAGRLARRRYGWGARAARAAADAAPILATRPDIVHVGLSGIGVALEDVWPLLGDVALVVSCRGTGELVQPLLDPERGPALARLFERATAVHVVAQAVGDAVVSAGADPSRVHVIRPAVDLDRWPRRASVAGGAPWQLVAVGRLVAAKGLDDLVAALATVRATGCDARLTIVGDGPHRDALTLRIARTGLADVVELAGSQAPDQVAVTLAGADLVVSPSLSEGINNGVLEAMATGVPVVSTEVGGMAEVITHDLDGWLVPPGRPELLAAAIGSALRDPGARARTADAARARIEAEFTLPRQVAEWLAIYGGLPGSAADASQEEPNR